MINQIIFIHILFSTVRFVTQEVLNVFWGMVWVISV